MNWVLDLDGVLWLGGAPIAGSAEAVAILLGRGDDVVFATNNSAATIAEQEAKLARFGVEAGGRVVSSAVAVGALVEAGERVLLCAGPGADEAMRAAGASVVDGTRGPDPGPVDAVVVGYHRTFDYEVMRRAATAVLGGARLLATNDDSTYPTPDGVIPGAGSILAGIERASGTRATIAGKPHEAMAAVIRARFGHDGVVVGDRDDTDGRFAVTLGYRFALVLSGVWVSAEGCDPVPDAIAADLATLVSAPDANLGWFSTPERR